jgi:GT2 family glycosyltransferase
VIVVSFNTRDETLACLESALSDAPSGTEVIVVDNGSDDGSAAAIRRRFPGVLVDEAGENLGFARGVNRGVAQSRGEYVLLLNPDTFVHEGALRALLDFAVSHPDYGVYGGRTVHRDGTVDPRSCWGAMTPWSLLCFASGLSTALHGTLLFDPESLGSWKRDSVRVVDIVTGCFLLTSRASWDALGGMDEAYFLYGEDADFSIRAARSGYRPVIVPDAVIVHDAGGSTPNGGNKMCMVMAGKATLLRRSWSPFRARIGIGLLLAGSLLRATLERLRGRRGAWTTVWNRRADWNAGYPAARSALFGIRAGA